MGNPFFTSLDPAGVPDPVTPHGGPGDAAGYAKVTPPGLGPAPAPYDISAPQDIAGITAATQAAMALSGGQEGASTGAGIPNRDSPRQQESLNILNGPQGGPGVGVFSGFPDYENTDLRPDSDLNVPAQGEMGTYPVSNTYQPGLPQFMAGLGAGDNAGIPGVPPEGGNMGPGGLDYPGTVQSGLTKYGTS